VFPPATEKWEPKQLPQQDEQAIKLFEDLRGQSADWFGIVAKHYEDIQEKHPLLAQHINKTCLKQTQTKDFVIYKILKSDEIAEANH
jgi:hypothetical protein